MNLRWFEGWAAFGLAALAWGGGGAACGGEPRPNILVIMGDNWSWPHAGILGDRLCKTPTFDRLGREGMLFTHAFAPHPSCAPSRAAMLTGMVSHRLEDGANLLGRLPAKFAVFPDLLEAAGYQIGYAGKGWSPGSVEESGRTRNPAGVKFASFDEFMAKLPAGKPFWFWFSSRHPHRPWTDARENKAGMRPEDAVVPPYLPDQPTVRDDILNYACEVIDFDSEAGEMVRLLEDRGLSDNTLIVMTSDNGWQMPRGLANCYDSGTRIPMALRWKAKVPGGQSIDAFVSLTDLAATFLEAAGLPVPAEMDSLSLLPLARGESQASRDAVFVERERHANVRKGDLSYPVRGIRTRDFLYLRNLSPGRWPAGDPEYYWSVDEYGDIDWTPTKALIEAGETDPVMGHYFRLAFAKRPAEELFDLSRDPGQTNNVAADPAYAEALGQLRGRVTRWMEATGDPRAKGETDFWDRAPYYAKPSRQKEE
ncbi:MAG: sulfatase [Verrucomicrobiae bacterium]|nr:sulfatase [Verrucomicrobiae bacterium]